MTKKNENISFEESMQGLETIVSQLESGELPLDKALEAFEKGSKLAEQCQKKLSDAEMRLEKVMTNKNIEK